ncbi:MAG: hypothetical protein M3137_02605, partial [Actinomycetota bacterium]|nr:hypothetical protein [Actinomycetota bacterium]
MPAQYGSLGGGLPRERVDVPERVPRQRRPFRWKVWREESGDLLDEPDEPETPGDAARPDDAVSDHRPATV